MKRNKLLLILAIVVVVTLVLAGCTTPCDHAEYGDWTITLNPTTTTAGKASHKCTNCDDTEEISIPALTDTSVWTKDADNSVPASHTAAGKDVYKSVYGAVEVTLPAGSHDPAVEVTVTTAPELNTAGAATYVCSCGTTVPVTLAKLSDTAAWTASDVTEADYINDGSATYTHKTLKSAETHELLTYTVETSNLVAPYDGRKYNSALDISSSPYIRSTASVALDEHGMGVGTAWPFNGMNTVTGYNPATGAITYTVTPGSVNSETGEFVPSGSAATVYTGFVDESTGLIVITKDNYATAELLSPYQVIVSADYTVMYLDANTFVVSFSYKVNADDENSATINIYASNDTVLFGVSLLDESGEAATLANAANYAANQLIVKDGSTVVATYAKDGSSFVKVNTYTNGGDTLVVHANGKFTLGNKSGEYTVVTGESNKIDAYVLDGTTKVEHYIYTLNADGTYTAQAQTVSVTVNFDHGVATVTKDMFIGCVVDTDSLLEAGSTYIVTGIYTDADHEDVLVNNTITATTTTLHVALLTNVSITLHNLVDDETLTINLAEGSLISAKLPEYVVGTTKKGTDTFAGWYTDSDCTIELAASATASASITDIYAKWEGAPAWTSMDTCATVVVNGESVTLTGTVNEEYSTYYIKLDIKQSGKYVFYTSGYPKEPNADKTVGYVGYYVLNNQGQAIDGVGASGTGKISYSGTTTVTLESGIYYVKHASDAGHDIACIFEIIVAPSLHDSADTAIEYTLGTTVSTSNPIPSTSATKTVYKVDLEADVAYTMVFSTVQRAQLAIRTAENIDKSANAATSGWINAGQSSTKEITVSTTGTYYIVVTSECTFSITAPTTSGGDDGASALAGKTYSLDDEAYWEIKFNSGDDISGTIYLGMYSQTTTFTGVLEGDTLTLTLGTHAALTAGTQMVFTVSDGALTQTSANITVYGNTSSTGAVYALKA